MAENLILSRSGFTPGRDTSSPITHADVARTTAGGVLMLLAGAIPGWVFPVSGLVGGIAALILVIWAAFQPHAVGRVFLGAMSFGTGMMLGAMSVMLEAKLPGVVVQAAAATISTFIVVQLLHRSGKVRSTPKLSRIASALLLGMLAFAFVDLLLSFTGVVSGPFGLASGWLGVALGLLGVAMGAYFFVEDLDRVDALVAQGAPRSIRHTVALGLIVTIMWMYAEFLRLIGNARYL